jgi:hypothetical protein
MPLPWLHRLFSLNREHVILSFRFRPNGNGAIDQNTITGAGVSSVTRLNVGVYGVVLTGHYASIESVVVSRLRSSDASEKNSFEITKPSNLGDNTYFTISHYEDGVAAEIASDASNWVCVTINARRSAVR